MITSLSYYITCDDINSNIRDLVPNVRKLSLSIDNNVAISRSEFEAIKAKPGVFGFSINLKRLFTGRLPTPQQHILHGLRLTSFAKMLCISQTRETFPYPLRLIKHTTATTPIIVNKKPAGCRRLCGC